MNFRVGFPTGLPANAYTTQTTGTSTKFTITLNTTDRLHFTDHTATNRDVHIPEKP